MVSYQPIRLNFEDLPNDFMIKTMKYDEEWINCIEEEKDNVSAGGKNQWRVSGYCIPKTCPFEMWFVVCAGAKSIGEASVHMSTSVPSVKRRESQLCNFVRGSLPPFDCRNKRSDNLH